MVMSGAPWADRVIEQLRQLSARPEATAAAVHAIRVLGSPWRDIPPPAIVVTGPGGVHLEWRGDGWALAVTCEGGPLLGLDGERQPSGERIVASLAASIALECAATIVRMWRASRD